MQKYQDSVLSANASGDRPVGGASITVTQFPGGGAATIYSDNGVTTIIQPITTGPDGSFAFYAADGHYNISVSGPGIASRTITDVLLQDSAATLALPGAAATVGSTGPSTAQADLNARPTSATLAAPSGSSLVGWIRSAVSAVATTISEWLGWRAVSPLEFMSSAQRADVVNGTLALDHTAAVQAAIDTAKTVDLLGYSYNVNNLTQSTASQAIVSTKGAARLIKNANGPILTASASDAEFRNVGFRGESSTPAFTGDNLVSTGDNLRLINCGSRWAFSRAVKASGNHVQIVGTCDIYQTADATGTGFDIEVGVSGTSTLYHHIQSIKSAQRTGGVKFVDCGSQTLIGCQIGKVYIAAGTKPAGCNGGNTIGNRILGDVTVEQSNALLSNNLFDTGIAISFALGTSGCRLDASNGCTGVTITNSGNVNNFIQREVSAGSTTQVKYGPDASVAVLTINQGDGTFTMPGPVVMPNAASYKILDSGGTAQQAVSLNASNNWFFGAGLGTSSITVSSGSGGVNMTVGGTTIAQFYASGLRPQTTATYNNGTASQSWLFVYTKYAVTLPTTVSGLTGAATAGMGARAFVTDATLTTFGSVAVGGGTNKMPVWSDGTNWLIG